MTWKVCVVNRLFPEYENLIDGIDTGEESTSVGTRSPNAAEQEIIVYGSTAGLTDDDRDEIEAVIDTIATSYNLTYTTSQEDDGYFQYSIRNN